MITFKLTFTSGEKFTITDNCYKSFQSVLDKFLMLKNIIDIKAKYALINANKIDMNKTLLDNQIYNGSNVLLFVEKDVQNNNNINININNNDFNNFNNNNINNNLNNNFNNIFNNINAFNHNFNNFNNLNNNLVLGGNIFSPLNTFNNIMPNNFNMNLNFNMNTNLQQKKDILINGCHVPINLLDSRGDIENDWDTGRKSGPPGYLKDYFPPIGWTGIGLKVLDLYDNKDNRWLGNSNQDGEWYIAYHGIKAINIISSIINNGFKRGPFQGYKDYQNINPLSNREYPFCGEGVYFFPYFDDVKSNAYLLNYNGIKFRVILMCRINPYKARACKYGINNHELFIVNGDRLDDNFWRKRDDEVRLYRILIYIEDN